MTTMTQQYLQGFLSLLVLLSGSFLLTPVAACGGLFCEPSRPVLQAGEAIAFGVQGTNIQMHVQILYEGPASAFSWVLPVPKTPDNVSVGSDILFTSLFSETLPQFVLNIAQNESTTCTEDDFGPLACPMMMADAESAGGGGAVVLETGSVGPYDYVVLEPAENNPDSVFEWLSTNGYDQPEGADALLNYYALLGQKFVALKLTKDTESGDIQPLILEYNMEGADENTPIACVPIKLTAIAANDNMPVQVYVFADARAVPLNYLDVELDDAQVDWVGCLNNPGCYDDNYRARITEAMLPLDNHGFVTEYAGASNVMKDKVALVDINMDNLKASATWIDFFNQLANAGVPAIPLVTSIVDKYVPNTYDEGLFCSDLYIPDQIFNMANCAELYVPQSDWTFDATGMADELDEKVFGPARDSQAFVDSFSYMTRMYGVLSPANMDKDPFFTLNSNAPDVSNIHTATAVPVCVTGEGPVALEIRVDGSEPFTVAAEPFCNTWRPTGDDTTVIAAPISPVIALTSWGYANQEATVISRSLSGGFAEDEVKEAVAQADTLVVNQTVPVYATSDSSSGSSTNTDVSGSEPGSTTDTGGSDSSNTDTGSSEGSSSSALSPLQWCWGFSIVLFMPALMYWMDVGVHG